MVEIDVVVVGYRSEDFLGRLFSDLKIMTANKYAVHYFDNTGNPKTLSIAWNDLGNNGSAPFLAIINPDIALSPSWDERLIACLRANPDVGIATADPAPFSMSVPSREEMIKLSHERLGRKDLGTDPVQFFMAFMERTSWAALKGVDERMRFYMQDIDFIVRMSERLKKRTVRVFSCPIWHCGSASTRDAHTRKEIDSQAECDFGSWAFNEIRQGRMKEWDYLTPEERNGIRLEERYAIIPKPTPTG